MEHWFDRLAKAHPRRTTLKAAALAAGALVAPGVRLPRAWATTNEPCFKPCAAAASAAFAKDRNTCDRIVGAGYLGFALGPVPGVVMALVGQNNALQCSAASELNWYKATNACRGSECGNPAKYPGGATSPPPPPPSGCVESGGLICGDKCCNATGDPECCRCPKSGEYQCCAHGSCDCVANC
jgi:hypothetical protein